MKDFRQHLKKRRSKFFSALSYSVLAAVLVLAAIHSFFPESLSGLARTIARPLWSSGGTASNTAGVFFASLRSNRSLVLENQALKEDLVEFDMFSLKNQILEEENKTLKEMLGRRSFQHVVLAPVLQRPPATPYDTLLVDIGNSTEVAVGNRVVVGGSIIIGTISRVNGSVGTVFLFSAPGVKTDVFLGTSTASVVAEGRGGGNFLIEAPKDLLVEIGDSITLPNIAPLIFSVVASIDVEPSDPFQTIRFRSPVNFNNLRWVEVITNNTEIPRGLYDEEENTTEEEDATTEVLTPQTL